MTRIVFVWLPHWPIERMRRAARMGQPRPSCDGLRSGRGVPDDGPFALVESGPRGLAVSALNAAARTAGVRVGRALADARAAVPGLVTAPAELVQDRLALRRLALWAGRYGPRRNTDCDDGLWVDITGAAHLFGGEAALLADLVGRLRAEGITAAAAIADTFAAAAALARFAPQFQRQELQRKSGCIAAPGGTAAALAGLPVEALRLEIRAVMLLKRLGLRHVGQLYALPRVALARRFREAGTARGRLARSRRAEADLANAVLDRLDAALGQAAAPRAEMAEPVRPMVRSLWVEPLMTSGGIEAAVAALADELASVLAAATAGARRVRLRLYRVDGTVAAITVGTSRPCQDGSHMTGLLGEKLAGIDAGFGIDVVTLEAVRFEPVSASQQVFGRHLASHDRQAFDLLLDRMTNRLGTDRVRRLATGASHLPEAAGIAVPIAAEGLDVTGKAMAMAAARLGTGAARPLLLLTTPEPIEVMAAVPDGPPIRFTWRRLPHRIARAEGPERIAPEWWRWIGQTTAETARDGEASAAPPTPPRSRPRDYYRVEDQAGARFWVFRAGLYDSEEGSVEATAGPPVWYMHGLFG